MAQTVNSVISENSEKMPMYTYIGLAAVALSLIGMFVSPITNNLETNPLYIIIALANSACTALAMYYIYDSLKKGMANLETPLTSMLQYCAWFVLGYYGLSILANLLAFGGGSVVGGGMFMTLAGLLGLVYFILYIIVGCKIMSNYEGKLKLLGILFVAIPAILVVSTIVGGFASFAAGGGFGFTKIIGILGAGLTAYQYLVAHEVITGKKLF